MSVTLLSKIFFKTTVSLLLQRALDELERRREREMETFKRVSVWFCYLRCFVLYAIIEMQGNE